MAESSDEAPRILVVDDEQVIREILADFLSMEGFLVRTAADGSEALVELSRSRYDLVLSDLKMPKMGGLELLEAIQKHTPHVVTVIMTGFGTVETAIDAMKRGAYDYILKPFKVEEVVHTIRRGLEKQKLRAENMRLKEALSLYKVSEAIASSLSLDQVLGTVHEAALGEVNADHVIIMLQNGEGGFFERINDVSHDFGFTIDELPKLHPERLLLHFEEEPHLRAHGETALQYFADLPDHPRPSAVLITALRVRKEVIGFLAVVSYVRGRRFDEG